jgi:hypothetical protein
MQHEPANTNQPTSQHKHANISNLKAGLNLKPYTLNINNLKPYISQHQQP